MWFGALVVHNIIQGQVCHAGIIAHARTSHKQIINSSLSLVSFQAETIQQIHNHHHIFKANICIALRVILV
jgi:hypothetical protein